MSRDPSLHRSQTIATSGHPPRMGAVARSFSLATLLLIGCSSNTHSPALSAATNHALSAPDRIEVLVLGERLESSSDGFDQRQVLATIEVDSARYEAIVTELVDALEYDGMVASCFEPHHGLRVHRGGAVAEMSICFHCSLLNEMSSGGPYEAVARGDLNELLDAIIEERTAFHYDESAGSFGAWVASTAGR